MPANFAEVSLKNEALLYFYAMSELSTDALLLLENTGAILQASEEALQLLAVTTPLHGVHIADFFNDFELSWLACNDELRWLNTQDGLIPCKIYGRGIDGTNEYLLRLEAGDQLVVKHAYTALSGPISGAFLSDAAGVIYWTNEALQKNLGIAANPNQKLMASTLFSESFESMLNGEDRLIFLKSGPRKSHTLRVRLFPLPLNIQKQGCFAGLVQQVVQQTVWEPNAQLAYSLLQQTSLVSRAGGWYLNLENGKTYFTEVTRQIHEIDVHFDLNIENGLQFFKKAYARKRITTAFKNLIEAGEPYELELPFTTAKGREIWVKTTGTGHFENGKITSIYGTIQDITHERASLSLFKQQSEEYGSIISALPDLIFKFNRNNQFTYFHTNDKSSLVLKPEQFMYKRLEQVFPEALAIAMGAQLQLARQSSKVINYEYSLDKKQFEARIVRINQREVLAIVRDITALNRAETILRETNEQLQHHNMRLSNFAHIVSHNLRAHTSNISALVNAIEMETEADDKIELVNLLKVPAEHLNRTIQALNQVVAMPRKVDELSEPVLLSSVAKNCIQQLAPQISEANAQIITRLDQKVRVHGVEAFMEGILQNLLTNALKYRDPQKPLHIELTAKTIDDWVEICVSDNGLGIDLDKYGSRVFGLYKTFHGNADALGLGLFMSKNQVEAMGGSISINSEMGQGTSLYIRLKKA
jgi:two-component system, OmpR family, aerobic respiration control sensor histidine kinase ArcB